MQKNQRTKKNPTFQNKTKKAPPRISLFVLYCVILAPCSGGGGYNLCREGKFVVSNKWEVKNRVNSCMAGFRSPHIGLSSWFLSCPDWPCFDFIFRTHVIHKMVAAAPAWYLLNLKSNRRGKCPFCLISLSGCSSKSPEISSDSFWLTCLKCLFLDQSL